MPFLCYLKYDENAVGEDTMMLFETELEAEFWKKVITTTYRDDKAIIREIPLEPKFAIKENH
jgi:hypothetical protein